MVVKQKIFTNLVAGNSNIQVLLPDGTTMQFLFYYNDLNSRIGFNLSINGVLQFKNIDMTLTKNMLAPLDQYGTLYIRGDYPTLSTIDASSVLFFEKTT